MSMPPRLKPRIPPRTAAANMVPGEELGVVREKRAAVYASERVQKASRTYMGDTFQRHCAMNHPRIEESLALSRIKMATLTFFRWIELPFPEPLLFIPPLLYTKAV